MSEPDFSMKIENQLELVDYLYKLAVKYKDSFHGMVASVESKTLIASVNVMEEGKQVSYRLTANTPGDVLAFRSFLRNTFTVDKYTMSAAAIVEYVEQSQREDEQQQQTENTKTRRFRLTIAAVIIASILSALLTAYFSNRDYTKQFADFEQRIGNLEINLLTSTGTPTATTQPADK